MAAIDLIDLEGKTFGQWRVLYKGPSSTNPRWMCRCDKCGARQWIIGQYLRRSIRTACRVCKGKRIQRQIDRMTIHT